MGFWQNVREIIEFRAIIRKELEKFSGVPKYTIDKGIERDSEVAAIVAIKISNALNVDLETLLEIDKKQIPNQKDVNGKSWLLEKYASLLSALEKMPKDTQEKFIALAEAYSEQFDVKNSRI